ncbi:type 12 methyltransferase [Gracilibacillus halophilus YIM-C55.5]|uniref:Type 12 methyltransferase n=1 Tax=Gracilibacillus halophilus YIM-C55.5 TaxID=1308866 RepID=N4WM58_9BACI|nr:class I SAM-dependent methyltransferase [Gracilibacillus halophilus]ENH97257.1 type 12 methyltransferase [Gracilibacillus halophilus YIM-C55.5]
MEYELLLDQSKSYSEDKTNNSLENSLRIKLLVRASEILGIRDTPLFQLLLFSKVKNYIRFIVLRKIYEMFPDVLNIKQENKHENIFNSFMELGIQLDMITLNTYTYSLNENYLLKEKARHNVIHYEYQNDNQAINEILHDYHFIEDAINASSNQTLSKIMKKKDYVYIKEVLKYIQEINQLDFHQQISPSFSEDFYTDLGELAFNIYTKDNYQSFISQKQYSSILDIGCGNGNYIDVHLNDGIPNIVGVERQERVFEKLKTKYKANSNIVIYNDDIMNLSFHEKFDMINMSYMLFYLTEDEKENLFMKLKHILNNEGAIIICQYYPDFEIYQELIAKHNKSWDFISRFKYDICNSILRAEVVLNNMLVDFEKAEQWDPFLNLLDNCGFEVSEISPADDNYYSYFITIKHK